ncbi:MAG: DUF2339 domain-containing protein [Chloroflexi bacterium]|nr:DUF2339 domain-containing protein [Chloroflexota bacterium]
MQCPNCQNENPLQARFCGKCGAPLVGVASQQGEVSQETRREDATPSLQSELREMRRVLIQLSDRVAALERIAGITVRPAAPAAPATQATMPPPPAAMPPLSPELRSAEASAGGPPTPAAAAGPPQAEPAEPGPPAPGFAVDWEQVLGMNWLAIIGAVALAVGVGFFLKLAFENNWIGPTGRVALGIGTGVALLGGGEFTQRRYPKWAQAVTGGGIGILYLSIYASFGFYKLVDPLAAFAFLALVVMLSGLLALRYESLVIALLGILGAFLTPVLLGRQLDSAMRFLVVLYIILVDAGILGVATFRNWRWLTLVGLIASYSLFALMIDDVSSADLVRMQLGVTATFLIFVGATTLFHVLWRRVPGRADMALMTLNAVGYFGLTYGLLWERYEVWFGGIALALSFFYGLVGYGAIRRTGAPPQVALYSLATALVFLTVAAPLQLTGTWITVAWAAEAAVLAWVGFTLGTWQTRAFGLGVFAIAAFRLLVFDTTISLVDFKPFLNARFPTFVVGIAALYVAAYLYRRGRSRLQEWEEYVGLALAGAANLFTLWILSAEVISFFDSRSPAQMLYRDAVNAKLLSLTALWAVYAGGLLAVALGTRSSVLRWAGLGLLTIPVLKLVLFDTFEVRLTPITYRLALNFHFLTFLVVLGVVLFAAYLYWRLQSGLTAFERAQRAAKEWEGERYVLPALLIVANVLAVWVLSAEAIRYFDSREVLLRTDLESAKHLSLTVLWAVYATGIIGVGMARQASNLRLAGLALLAIPVAKLFVFDVFLLERFYRVAAFVTLGLLLLATGLAYQRYGIAIRGFLFGKEASR